MYKFSLLKYTNCKDINVNCKEKLIGFTTKPVDVCGTHRSHGVQFLSAITPQNCQLHPLLPKTFKMQRSHIEWISCLILSV